MPFEKTEINDGNTRGIPRKSWELQAKGEGESYTKERDRESLQFLLLPERKAEEGGSVLSLGERLGRRRGSSKKGGEGAVKEGGSLPTIFHGGKYEEGRDILWLRECKTERCQEGQKKERIKPTVKEPQLLAKGIRQENEEKKTTGSFQIEGPKNFGGEKRKKRREYKGLGT